MPLLHQIHLSTIKNMLSAISQRTATATMMGKAKESNNTNQLHLLKAPSEMRVASFSLNGRRLYNRRAAAGAEEIKIYNSKLSE